MKFTLFFLAVTLAAQTPMARQGATNTFSGSNTFTGVVDAGDATSFKLKRGTTLPATCTVGQVFFKTDATAGQNFYGCSSTDTWTVQGPVTTLPTLDPLEYLRAAPNVSSYTLEGHALPEAYAPDYQWSQTPGGSISIGTNTITLTPCPLGVSGSQTLQYVYLSNGTGTAEAALITGGSCTSGASSGTLAFTAANTHTGAWTIATASAGIREAANVLPSGGGRVRIPSSGSPYTIYQTISIGNGSNSAPSTIANISLDGDGAGNSTSETIAPSLLSLRLTAPTVEWMT